jgi:ABC-2 family transporter protein
VCMYVCQHVVSVCVVDLPVDVCIVAPKNQVTALLVSFTLSLSLFSHHHAFFLSYNESVVLERRKKLTEFSKLMGLRVTAYWTGSFLFDFGVHLFYCALAVLFGYIMQMATFKLSGGPTILLLLLWGLAQVPTGYVIGAFFKDERTATIASYLLCFFGEILAVCLNMFMFPLQRAPWW